jgi:peroxiredoxin
MPEVGSVAPDFTLSDQRGEQVVLSDFRGKQSVLLVFYPFAFSRTCTRELCSVRDDLESFQNASVQVLAISVDHRHTLRAYAAAEGYEFPLLSDFWPHGAVAQQYGVFNESAGFAQRGTFLIDPDGVVRFAEVNDISEGRDPHAWKQAMAGRPA